MNPALDKRGGRTDNGTIGRKEQREMKKEFGIADAWRKRNPNTIGTTWSNGVKTKQKE